MTSALAPSALEFAARSHSRQLRGSDGAAFIEHPLEVARLLRDAGCSEELVAAGLLHDVVEGTDVEIGELANLFGSVVADLVDAVSEDDRIEGFRQRKHALREQVRHAGRDAAILFAADKVSNVRDMHVRVLGVPAGEASLAEVDLLRVEHYQRSLAMLRTVLPCHPLVVRLADELACCLPAVRARSRPRPQPTA